MKNPPINPLSSKDQQKIMEQMYLLMGKQVQSYHQHRHMGSNSSVPVELAQDLIESIEYTIKQVGGLNAHASLEEMLMLGQQILEGKLDKANKMLELVCGTAPQWQTVCRWEALQYLRHYLDQYDLRHLAHIAPDELFYPILISPPESIQGIDSCLFNLNILWIENQIMAGVSDETLESFCNRLPAAALNQCEYLLINGIGKALISKGLNPLYFTAEELTQLIEAMNDASEYKLKNAANVLCEWLNLNNEDARMYVQSVIPQLIMWTEDNIRSDNIASVFIC